LIGPLIPKHNAYIGAVTKPKGDGRLTKPEGQKPKTK
jgi:hypothetical protein